MTTILAAVNDIFFYTKLRDALKQQGYHLERARAQQEVSDKAAALLPAAVIMDIMRKSALGRKPNDSASPGSSPAMNFPLGPAIS